MIIECPACVTRYDIKADLPPEGRSVRCAKCGTVWRAMPDSPEEPEAEDLAWAISQAREAIEGQQTEERDEGPYAGGLEHGRENEWTSPEASAGVDLQESWPQEDIAHVEGNGIAEETPPEQHREAVKAEGGGKVSWFSSFRRKKRHKEEAEEGAAAGHEQMSAETIPFPRASPAVQSQGAADEEYRTLEEARQAVRGVFLSLGNGRPSQHAARAVMAPVSASAAEEEPEEGERPGAETQPDHSLWNGGSPSKEAGFGGFWANAAGEAKAWDSAAIGQADSDAWQALDGKREPSPVEMSEPDGAEAEQKREGPQSGQEADAALRDAMRAHFPAPDKEPAPSPFPNEDLADRLETHFRSSAAPALDETQPSERAAGLWATSPSPADEDMNEAPPVVEETPESSDDGAAFDHRLYREIEETQERSGEGQRRGGGLALAAAWGLFICVAGGLVAGFFVFRDIVADAAPGLAPLYRILGAPVTVQPLIFEGVQTNWKVVENKPVLVVSGSVYNRAQRKVRVPEFYINIKDQDPALDREYSANLKVAGSRIRANERADFDIELVSPSPSITSVELELRNVR
jgi:predicted Zn finger-like uncharacterized protein